MNTIVSLLLNCQFCTVCNRVQKHSFRDMNEFNSFLLRLFNNTEDNDRLYAMMFNFQTMLCKKKDPKPAVQTIRPPVHPSFRMSKNRNWTLLYGQETIEQCVYSRVGSMEKSSVACLSLPSLKGLHLSPPPSSGKKSWKTWRWGVSRTIKLTLNWVLRHFKLKNLKHKEYQGPVDAYVTFCPLHYRIRVKELEEASKAIKSNPLLNAVIQIKVWNTVF